MLTTDDSESTSEFVKMLQLLCHTVSAVTFLFAALTMRCGLARRKKRENRWNHRHRVGSGSGGTRKNKLRIAADNRPSSTQLKRVPSFAYRRDLSNAKMTILFFFCFLYFLANILIRFLSSNWRRWKLSRRRMETFLLFASLFFIWLP